MTSIYIKPVDPIIRAVPIPGLAPRFKVLPFNKAIVTNPDIFFNEPEHCLILTRAGLYQILTRVQLIYVMGPTGNTSVYTNFRATIECRKKDTQTWTPITSSYQDLLPNYQTVPDGRWNTVIVNYMDYFEKGDALRIIVQNTISKDVKDVDLYSVLVGTTEPAFNNVEQEPLVPVTLFSVNRLA